jgi:hypothetical protein
VFVIGAFSGKVESGFPCENATVQELLERFLFPVGVKPLQAFVMKCSASVFKLSIEVDVAGEALAVLPRPSPVGSPMNRRLF